MWTDFQTLAGLLAVLALLALAIIRFARRRARPRRRPTAQADRDDALRLLRQRLLRGDISQETYDTLRRSIAD